MHNFSELKTKVSRVLQRSTDTDYIADVIPDFINYSHKFLADSFDYFQELEETYNFSTVDGTANYYMPLWFNKPLRIYDLTNKKLIKIITQEEYFDSNISNIADATEGAPTNARMYGVKGINAEISSATIAKVKSSSALDTAGAKVRVEGYLDSGKTIIGYEDITISTSTPTTFVSGSISFYEFIHVGKSVDTTGTITIANSADATIASLGPTDRVARYKRMILGLIPDAVYSIRVLLKKKEQKLVNDNDYPFMDADDFLITHSAAYGFAQEKETVERSVQLFQKSKELLGLILQNQTNRLGPDYQHKMDSIFLQSHRR